MFNKKGDHVDWAISMGIFLLYLVGLFILLRPGITPVYEPDGLLQILENNLMKEVTYEVREIPLFIELCKGNFVGGAEGCIKNSIRVEDTIPNFNFKNPVDDKKNPVSTDCGCSPGEDDIIKKVFYYTYSQIYPEKKEAEINYECIPWKEKDFCKIRLGASTTKTGVKNGWINKLKPEDGKEKETYDELKKRWNTPLDFAIYYADSNTENILIDSNKIIGGQKMEGINIFSKEIKTNELSDSGTFTPKTIIIQVW